MIRVLNLQTKVPQATRIKSTETERLHEEKINNIYRLISYNNRRIRANLKMVAYLEPDPPGQRETIKPKALR